MAPRGKAGRCTGTVDWLTEYVPPQQDVVLRHDPERMKSVTLDGQIARAVSETLRECDLSREEIAAAMSEFLGERITRAVLDGYASEAKEQHSITFFRLCALVKVTGDARALSVAADLAGAAVIEGRYLYAVEEAQYLARIDELEEAVSDLTARKKQARRRWRKPG